MTLSSEIPKDLQNIFSGLEQQAVATLRAGQYELAEKLFRTMLDTIMKHQTDEKRRIHKGSLYHNIGFSLVLQNRLNDGLRNFLLAYIEDCLNVPTNREDEADGYPAARVLRKGFSLQERYLIDLKQTLRSTKLSNRQVLDPDATLGDFLKDAGVDQDDLSALCSRKPTIADVRDTLVVNLTPEAKQVLDNIVSKQTDDVIRKAAAIARRRKSSFVTDADVKEAIGQLEEEGR